MANQVLKRMEQMGGRIDQLERSICDLIAEAEQVDTDSSAATSNIFKQLPAVKVQKESQ
jgi:hypothetical protein